MLQEWGFWFGFGSYKSVPGSSWYNYFQCLTSESKGRFLVNNILLAWSLVMAQMQFSLICASRTLANLLPPTYDNISFSPITSLFDKLSSELEDLHHQCIFVLGLGFQHMKYCNLKNLDILIFVWIKMKTCFFRK